MKTRWPLVRYLLQISARPPHETILNHSVSVLREPSFVVQLRRHRQRRPVLVGDLVVCHPRGIDLAERQVFPVLPDSDRHLGGGAGRCLHRQQEFELVAGFIEQVVDAIACFRDSRFAVVEFNRPVQDLLPLVKVHQRPHGDAAVDVALNNRGLPHWSGGPPKTAPPPR